jgi:hypothetical protein
MLLKNRLIEGWKWDRPSALQTKNNSSYGKRMPKPVFSGYSRYSPDLAAKVPGFGAMLPFRSEKGFILHRTARFGSKK